MPSAPRLPSLLALAGAGALAACATPEYTSGQVVVEHDDGLVAVALLGPEEPPCPELVGDVSARVNGVDAWVIETGGQASDPDVDYDWCDQREMEARGVPLTGGPLVVEIDSRELGVRMEVDWPAEHRVWTDDDLAAAVAAGDPFTVRWTPEDAELGELSAYGADAELDGVSFELVDEAPGQARFRWIGDAPEGAWEIVAVTRLVRDATGCIGLDECRYFSTRHLGLRTP